MLLFAQGGKDIGQSHYTGSNEFQICFYNVHTHIPRFVQRKYKPDLGQIEQM